MNSQMFAKKILRQGYYWPAMDRDWLDYVRRCPKVPNACKLGPSTYCALPFDDDTLAFLHVGLQRNWYD